MALFAEMCRSFGKCILFSKADKSSREDYYYKMHKNRRGVNIFLRNYILFGHLVTLSVLCREANTTHMQANGSAQFEQVSPSLC